MSRRSACSCLHRAARRVLAEDGRGRGTAAARHAGRPPHASRDLGLAAPAGPAALCARLSQRGSKAGRSRAPPGAGRASTRCPARRRGQARRRRARGDRTQLQREPDRRRRRRPGGVAEGQRAVLSAASRRAAAASSGSSRVDRDRPATPAARTGSSTPGQVRAARPRGRGRTGPFGSRRSHSSSEVATWTSRNGSSSRSCTARAAARSRAVGRHERDQHDDAGVGQQRRRLRGAAHVLRTVRRPRSRGRR